MTGSDPTRCGDATDESSHQVDAATSDDTAGGVVDPWAPGGAMAEIPEPGAGAIRLSFEAADDRPAAPARPSHRRRWIIGAVIVAIGCAVVLASGLGDDDRSTDPAVSTTVPLASGLPDATRDTAPATTPLSSAADPPPDSTVDRNPTQRLVLAAAPRRFVVSVAPELAEINPTEVVAFDGDAGLYEVSLPSGRVRVTDLGFSTDQRQLAVNDRSAVVWPTPEGGAQIITTTGSIGVPEARVDHVSWSPNTDRMYLWSTRSSADDGESSVLSLDGDGESMQWRAVDWVDDPEVPAVLLDFDGDLLRADTGGTYRVGPSTTGRVTSGDIVANGPNHLLLRECDDARSCRLVSLAADGTRTEWPTDLPDGVVPQPVAGVSPGGDALLVVGRRLSTDAPGALQVLELADGSLQPLPAPSNLGGFASWDTTGAGVFTADLQLLYVDRFTGEAVIVSEELPRLREARTRRPAATPICEILEITLPRFGDMAAAGTDNELSAPPADALERMATLAPAALQQSTATVVDFVTGFVSPEVPDSQTVAFWPAAVTDGIDALDAYAVAECRFASR